MVFLLPRESIVETIVPNPRMRYYDGLRRQIALIECDGHVLQLYEGRSEGRVNGGCVCFSICPLGWLDGVKSKKGITKAPVYRPGVVCGVGDGGGDKRGVLIGNGTTRPAQNWVHYRWNHCSRLAGPLYYNRMSTIINKCHQNIPSGLLNAIEEPWKTLRSPKRSTKSVKNTKKRWIQIFLSIEAQK